MLESNLTIEEEIELFSERRETGCVEWTGTQAWNRSGCPSPVLRWKTITYNVRTFLYRKHIGELRKGGKIRMKCGNSWCVALDHMVLPKQLPRPGEVVGYCGKGHPYTRANIRVNSGGYLTCLTCSRAQRREEWARKYKNDPEFRRKRLERRRERKEQQRVYAAQPANHPFRDHWKMRRPIITPKIGAGA